MGYLIHLELVQEYGFPCNILSPKKHVDQHYGFREFSIPAQLTSPKIQT